MLIYSDMCSFLKLFSSKKGLLFVIKALTITKNRIVALIQCYFENFQVIIAWYDSDHKAAIRFATLMIKDTVTIICHQFLQ